MTYFRKLHPDGKTLEKGTQGENGTLTIQSSGNPMEDGTPEIYPPYELQIVRRVRLPFNDVEYRLVQHRDGPGNTSDAERLGTKYGEDERCHE